MFKINKTFYLLLFSQEKFAQDFFFFTFWLWYDILLPNYTAEVWRQDLVWTVLLQQMTGTVRYDSGHIDGDDEHG